MEFRPMRRIRQQLSEEESLDILTKATSGVLALSGDNGYPYAVPLSHVYNDGHLYFHSALEGHKVDAVRNNSRCSFCVVQQDVVCPERFTTLFRSVIAFGQVHEVTDAEERLHALRLLGERFNPGDNIGLKKEIEHGLNRVLILRLDVEHLTGKEAIELVRQRQES